MIWSVELDIEDLALAHQPSTSSVHPSSYASQQQQQIQDLQSQLQASLDVVSAQKQILKNQFEARFGGMEEALPSTATSVKGKEKDDDTHYFQSYSKNGR